MGPPLARGMDDVLAGDLKRETNGPAYWIKKAMHYGLLDATVETREEDTSADNRPENLPGVGDQLRELTSNRSKQAAVATLQPPHPQEPDLPWEGAISFLDWLKSLPPGSKLKVGPLPPRRPQASTSPPPTEPVLKPASEEQKRWLRSPAGQWFLIQQVWDKYLAEPRLDAEASMFGLDPDDLQFPQGDPAVLLRLFKKLNPNLDPLHWPKDDYELAAGVLRMLLPENQE